MIRVCYYKGCGVVFGEKRPLSDKRITHGLCPRHRKISLKEIKTEMEKYSMVNRWMWMRHALTPAGEDPLDKVVIEGDGVTAVENETQKDHPVATFFLRRKFVKIAIATLVVIVLLPVWSVVATSWNNTDHLFFIERNKKNTLSTMMSNGWRIMTFVNQAPW